MPRILTTHTGSLHRPSELVAQITRRRAGEQVDGFEDAVATATSGVVSEQVLAGIDIVNDGEQGKNSYAGYVFDRLSGFEPNVTPPHRYLDVVDHPDFEEIQRAMEPTRYTQPSRGTACIGPIALQDPEAVHRDIARLAAAASAAHVGRERLFMSSASPGVIALFVENQFYPDQDEYFAAIIDAMRAEYRAIVDAGFLLQIDCPDLAMRQGERSRDREASDIRREIAVAVEALNAAVADLPADRMRIHLCWGNHESPHTYDVELADIIDVVLTARPAGLALEASNPRHGHEWAVFEDTPLPDDKYLLPGVIDTTTNFVEHPELVSQRLRNYTQLVGERRVVATTDCGFGTFAGRSRVARTVAWAKLRAMVEGARLASR